MSRVQLHHVLLGNNIRHKIITKYWRSYLHPLPELHSESPSDAGSGPLLTSLWPFNENELESRYPPKSDNYVERREHYLHIDRNQQALFSSGKHLLFHGYLLRSRRNWNQLENPHHKIGVAIIKIIVTPYTTNSTLSDLIMHQRNYYFH
jgi:hypothetical protein